MIVLWYFARIILYPFSSPRIEGNLRLARIDTRPHLVATSCGHSSRVTADFVGGTANHPTDENRWRGLRENRKSVAWASQKLKECCVGLRGISLLRKWPAWDFPFAKVARVGFSFGGGAYVAGPRDGLCASWRRLARTLGQKGCV